MNDLWSEPNRLAVEKAVAERREIANDLFYIVNLYGPIELGELLGYLSKYPTTNVSRTLSSALNHRWLVMGFESGVRLVSLGDDPDALWSSMV